MTVNQNTKLLTVKGKLSLRQIILGIGGGDAEKYVDGSGALSTPMGGGGGGSGLAVLGATKSLLSADLLAINSSPFELVAAPGENKKIVPIAYDANYLYGTSSYTGGSSLGVYFGDYNGGIIAFSLSNLIVEVSSVSRNGPAETVGNIDTEFLVNQPLMLAMSFEDPIDGDGSLMITVYYIVRDLSA